MEESKRFIDYYVLKYKIVPARSMLPQGYKEP